MNFTTTPNDPLIVPADADTASSSPSTGWIEIGTVLPAWLSASYDAAIVGHAANSGFTWAIAQPTGNQEIDYLASIDNGASYHFLAQWGLQLVPSLNLPSVYVTVNTSAGYAGTAAQPGTGLFIKPTFYGSPLPAAVAVPMGSVYRDIINNNSTISSGTGKQTVASVSFTGDVVGRIYRILARFACYSGTTGDVYNALLTVNGTQVDQSDTMVQHAANSDVHMLECEYTFTQPSDGATTTILLQTNLISGTGPLTVKGYGSAPFRLYVDDLGMNLS